MMIPRGSKALLVMALYAGAAAADAERGQLLYSTHCDGCHTEQVHWRAEKRASDWESLVSEVRRWQKNIKLEWPQDDVEAVARHLNRLHYRFPEPRRAS